MTDWRSTGVEILDRQLGGGIPEGSIVTLAASPASQSEQFLYELTTAAPALYLTTERPADAVRDALETEDGDTERTDVRAVGQEAPLDEARGHVDRADEGTNVIVDLVDPLERAAEEEYREFLVGVRAAVAERGGFAMLHALDGRRDSGHRDLTEYFSDAVFELRTRVRGEQIENRLVVAKFRGGTPFEEALKLELTERVRIDTSRDIA